MLLGSSFRQLIHPIEGKVMPEKLHYPEVRRHELVSSQVAQTFSINVLLPLQSHDEITRFPVVYVADGNLFFDIFKGLTQIEQMGGDPDCRYILVGIGYPGDGVAAGMILRGRDFTFAGYPQLALGRLTVDLTPIEGALLARPESPDVGGADDFQRFLGEELIPFIDANYPTLAGDRTYFGHSAGGAFGLYTMLTRRHLFGNYIVSSPAMTYNGTAGSGIVYDRYDFLFDRMREFAASGKSLAGTKLRLSVGTEEEFEETYRQFELTSSAYRMAALLRHLSLPGLDFSFKAFAGEGHQSAPIPAFRWGVSEMACRPPDPSSS